MHRFPFEELQETIHRIKIEAILFKHKHKKEWTLTEVGSNIWAQSQTILEKLESSWYTYTSAKSHCPLITNCLQLRFHS